MGKAGMVGYGGSGGAFLERSIKSACRYNTVSNSVSASIRVAIVFLACCGLTGAMPVVLVSGAGGRNVLEEQVTLGVRFYGLSLEKISVRQPTDAAKVLNALRQRDVVAAIFEADALSTLELGKVFAALHRDGIGNLPLLIVFSGSPNEARLAAAWSAGLVSDCKARTQASDKWELRFGQSSLAPQLVGVALPFKGIPSCGLELTNVSSGEVLVEAASPRDTFPVFVSTSIKQQQIFLLSGLNPDEPATQDRSRLLAAFANVAPVMMFLRHAAGERGWHAPGQYANLTVDDPWLVEPYGNLTYWALSTEMSHHNFHTTVAFIPWNFERSRDEVISLFRTNPERFSIAIHGNNHDHREFGDYEKVPLAEQAFGVKQALARMQRFSRNTGIPFDPVMVFPHAVAPAQTFELLRKYNYWSTANSENVPLGSVEPKDALFAFRPQTTVFGNFLSIKRQSAEIPVSRGLIAINSYLENPLLFYVHQEFFGKGAQAFNSIADDVNRIAPDTQWRNLGEIAQHSYLVRLRQDGDYDVLAFSPNLVFTNRQDRKVVFHVRKAEDFSLPIQCLNLDGAALSYQRLKDEITFDVPVGPQQARHIEMRYVNDLNLEQMPVSRTRVLASILRRLSDFRDITLSRSEAGQKLIAFYSHSRLNVLESNIERPVVLVLVSLIVLFLTGLLYRKLTLSGKRADRSFRLRRDETVEILSSGVASSSVVMRCENSSKVLGNRVPVAKDKI
jgi:hypothetical protein